MNAMSKKVIRQRNEYQRLEVEKMVKPYPEVDSEKAIESIKKVINSKNFAGINEYDIVAALENSDYFVRRENYREYMEYVDKLIPCSIKLAEIVNKPVEEALIRLGYGVIANYFDKELFEEQIKINSEPQISKDHLKSYLRQLSVSDIEDYISILLRYKDSHRLFMRGVDSTAMNLDFNEKCREIDDTITSMGTSGFLDLIKERGAFYFDQYLDKETIIDILCKHITKNVIMAENTAETFYNCGAELAFQYPAMVLSIQQNNPNIKVLM